MSEFLQYVFFELKNSLLLVLLAFAVLSAGIGFSYFLFQRKYSGSRKFPWGRTILWLAFFGYLLIVIYATLLRWSGFFHREWNLHLFRAWREAWNNFSVKNWANVLLNVALFCPMGFLLPLLSNRLKKWYISVPVCFCASLTVELLQLLLGRGFCDVDDLFCNTLGASIGYLAVMTALSLKSQKGKRAKSLFIYGGLCFALLASIFSVFIGYEWKMYGNLPQAAAYRNNTDAVVWSLKCDFPAVETQVGVYRIQTRSYDDCDAFAEAFKQIINTEYNTVSYYQEAAYYMDNGTEGGAHFLYVNYLDQGYTYSTHYDDNTAFIDADRETVEAALGKYPLMIPPNAAFAAEGEGWHSFTVTQQVDGDALLDGTLRVRYAADGTVRNIENGLLSYAYYDSVSVISPESAYQQLCEGHFNDNGYLEHRAPSQVDVQACTLGYAVDTKGFYQPVYYFEVESPAGDYKNRIMIPAMQ